MPKPTWSFLEVSWVAEEVAKIMKVDVEEMRGRSRRKDLNTARKMAMALAYRYTAHSFQTVGDFFNRNHATVLHANRSIEREIQKRGDLLGLAWNTLVHKLTQQIDAAGLVITEDSLPLLAKMVRAELPTPSLAVIEAVVRYVEQRERPGQFVSAVLSNDLFEAVGRADSQNALGLTWFVSFIYNNVPGSLRGSRESMRKHIENRKLIPPQVYMDWSTSCEPLAEHFRELFKGEKDAN